MCGAYTHISAVCCSLLQYIAVCCSESVANTHTYPQCVAVYCSTLQCVAVSLWHIHTHIRIHTYVWRKTAALNPELSHGLCVYMYEYVNMCINLSVENVLSMYVHVNTVCVCERERVNMCVSCMYSEQL